METMVNFIDMSLTKEEKVDNSIGVPYQSDYPYGLSICLNDDSLEKLDSSPSDFEVGSVVVFECMGKVTSVSQTDTPNGTCGRVEIQITGIAVDDDEDDPQPRKINYGKLYKK